MRGGVIGDAVGCDVDGRSGLVDLVVDGAAGIGVVAAGVVEAPGVAVVGPGVGVRCSGKGQAGAEVNRRHACGRSGRRMRGGVIGDAVGCDVDGRSGLVDLVVDGAAGIGVVAAGVVEAPGVAVVGPGVGVRCSGKGQAGAEVNRRHACGRARRRMRGGVIGDAVECDVDGRSGLIDLVVDGAAGIGVVAAGVVEAPGVGGVGPGVGVRCSGKGQAGAEVNRRHACGRARRRMRGGVIGDAVGCDVDGRGGLVDLVVDGAAGIGVVAAGVVEAPGVAVVGPGVGVRCSGEVQAGAEVNVAYACGRARRRVRGGVIGHGVGCDLDGRSGLVDFVVYGAAGIGVVASPVLGAPGLAVVGPGV